MSERTLAQIELFAPSEEEMATARLIAGDIATQDLREQVAEAFPWNDAEYDGITLKNGEKPVDDLTSAKLNIVLLDILGEMGSRWGLSKYERTEVGSLALSYAFEGIDKDLIVARSEEKLSSLDALYKQVHALAVGTRALIEDGSNEEWAMQRQHDLRIKHQLRYTGSPEATKRRSKHKKDLQRYINSQEK
jgi:hypothetical protein